MSNQYGYNKYAYMDGITIGLDKVTLKIPFNPPIPKKKPGQYSMEELEIVLKYRKEFLNHIQYIRNDLKADFNFSEPKKVKKNKHLEYINLFSQEGLYIATITLGLCYETPTLRLTFNPSKLDNKKLKELLEFISLNAFQSFYQNSVLAHCEFFLDIEDVVPFELALLDTGRRKTTLVEKETTYQGRRGSQTVGVMYNKAKESQQKGKLTRIEMRICRNKISLETLVEKGIANPFTQFIVVPQNALLAVASEWKSYPSLATGILWHGLYGGVKNPTARKAITTRLREFTVPWWKPDEIWERFQEILTIWFKQTMVCEVE